jgi:hypothetical protein
MALYMLSYDLRNQRDYQTLYDKLSEFKAKRVLESVWCFRRVNTSSADLRDFFKNYIDSDDGLLVAEVNNWATVNTKSTPKDL